MVGSVAALFAAKGSAIGGLFFFLFYIVIIAAFLFWGYKIAVGKGYAAWIGLVLAFFLGLIGIIILYVLPKKSKPSPMTSMGMPGSMPMAPPPMGGMTPPPAPMATPPAAPMASPPPAAPTPPPPAPPAPPAPPTA
jgi:hypothetical protein